MFFFVALNSGEKCRVVISFLACVYSGNMVHARLQLCYRLACFQLNYFLLYHASVVIWFIKINVLIPTHSPRFVCRMFSLDEFPQADGNESSFTVLWLPTSINNFSCSLHRFHGGCRCVLFL